MTTLTMPIREVSCPAGGTTFPRVVRSEWTKLRSLRSTWWTLSAMFVATVGFSALVSWGTASAYSGFSEMEKATFDPTANSLVGGIFGQLAVAVLGALIVTSEYTSGGIRTSLVAVPRRTRLLLAKAVVLIAATLTVGMVTCFTSFLVGQSFLSGKAPSVTLADPGVLRAVIGGGLYTAGAAMFGFALGALLRHSGAAITGVIAALLVLPNLMYLLPGEMGESIATWFTANAGYQVMMVVPVPGQPGPWAGLAGFTAQWLAIAVLAGVLMRRRDA